MAEQTIQAEEKVPDTVDSINNEAKCVRRTQEKLLGARKALKPLTQKVAVAVAEFAFVSPREPPDKMSPGQDALENAKECRAILTRVLERVAVPRRVSKYGIVAVTSRFATPWNTRAQWSCFICGLARAVSATDAQCSVYCAGVVRHIRCLLFSFPCCRDSSSCTQDCVFPT